MGPATALRQAFRQRLLPLQVLYTYGSGRRMDLLKTGEADFTIMSVAAAEDVCASDPTWQVLPLAPAQFYYADSWMALVRPAGPP